MKFFEFTDEFVDWLMLFACRRPILDVGCGEGHLLRALMQRTYRCHGLDIFPNASGADADVESNCTSAAVADAKVARFEGWLLVLARPSHGMLVESTLKGAASQVLILTRPSTIAEDVGPYPVEKLDVPGLVPACNGEEICAYLYTPKTAWWEEYTNSGWLRKLSRFYEPPYGTRLDESDLGDDTKTGRRAYDVRCIEPDPGLSHVRVELKDDPCQFHAWVAPWGQRFTCEYYNHEEVSFALGLGVEELEEMKWRRTFVLKGYPGEADAILFHRPLGAEDCEASPEQYASLDVLNERFAQY